MSSRTRVPPPRIFKIIGVFCALYYLFAGSLSIAQGQEADLGQSVRPLRSIPPPAPTAPTYPPDSNEPRQSHMEDESYGIPMPWGNPAFEDYRAKYLSEGGKKWLNAIALRAEPYLAFVFSRIHYYRMPEEFAFLPVIESEYSPFAVSRSGATGLWQFMRNSISGYGMHIDEWADERRDFMKSTDGALLKLLDNYNYFGDWLLALAAYNAGAGAIGKAVQKLKALGIEKPTFWDLKDNKLLKAETVSYIPKFLAIASILRYQGRNNLTVSWNETRWWVGVELDRPVDISIIAAKAEIPMASLKLANAELRYLVTPPRDHYLLKVPNDKTELIQKILSDPEIKLIRYTMYTVRSKDTLSGISRSYGVPVPQILAANPSIKNEMIKIGQVLVVPVFGNAPKPVAASAPPIEADDVLDFSGSYVIQPGDTLWNISLRYTVDPEILAKHNGLELGSVLRIGSTLRVPILTPSTP